VVGSDFSSVFPLVFERGGDCGGCCRFLVEPLASGNASGDASGDGEALLVGFGWRFGADFGRQGGGSAADVVVVGQGSPPAVD